MEHTGCIAASAQIRGADPGLTGLVTFRQLGAGMLVTAEVFGLPDGESGGVYAFHIHDGGACTGTAEDPFADAGNHYNPTGRPHPYHAGDLPPLFGNRGYAYLSVYTNRATVAELIGRVVVIHAGVDDFTSQPAGNAGAKIACGRILAQRGL